MKQSKQSLKYIYLKQIAGQIKQFRKVNKLSQINLGEKANVDDTSISQWEIESVYPSTFSIEKLEKAGVYFTAEQKGMARSISKYKAGASLTWEDKFNRAFTRVYNKDNSLGYDGDDWKVDKTLQPVKPSVIKAFIKEVVLKGGE